ncbi:MAG: P-loop NTPase [Armatimonadota bacterium]
MIDQATALRKLAEERVTIRKTAAVEADVKIIAVTSGHDKVGKSYVAVNLANTLLDEGKSIRFIDAGNDKDNAHDLLGVSLGPSFKNILNKKMKSNQVWQKISDKMHILNANNMINQKSGVDYSIALNIIDEAINSSQAGDIIIIDTPSLMSESLMPLLGVADELILVTTPEASSVTDSYAALKMIFNNFSDAKICLVANKCISISQAEGIIKRLDDICRKFLNMSFNSYEYIFEINTSKQNRNFDTLIKDNIKQLSGNVWINNLASNIELRLNLANMQNEQVVNAH